MTAKRYDAKDNDLMWLVPCALFSISEIHNQAKKAQNISYAADYFCKTGSLFSGIANKLDHRLELSIQSLIDHYLQLAHVHSC